jgi:hypothetical protein
LQAHRVADIDALEASHQLALHGDICEPHPGALIGSSGDDGVEALADASFEEKCDGGLLTRRSTLVAASSASVLCVASSSSWSLS